MDLNSLLHGILTAQTIVSAVSILIFVHVNLIAAAYLVYAERKISAYIQDRIGPNRVGFDFGLPILAPLKGMIGLGQPLADGIKFLLKEDFTPNNVDKILFTIAPAAIVICAFMGTVLIPWGGNMAIPEFTIPFINVHVDAATVAVGGAAHINVGLVYLLAITSLGVYGVTLGGYASNNKYSFLGGLRATAQMISYEIPLGLCILVVLLMVGSLKADAIINHQMTHGWLILGQPLACIIFFIAILAEGNRAPFDNAECEQELVGGYHTEYSSMRFALFFLAEYVSVLTGCAIFALCFLGAYHLPGVPMTHPSDTSILGVLVKTGVFLGKSVGLVCFMMVIRWTIPRLRYDQIMVAAWQGLIPITLVMVIVNSVLVYFGTTNPFYTSFANIVLGIIAMIVVGWSAPKIANRKIALAGSRFNPLPGEIPVTRPMRAAAADAPHQSLSVPQT